MKLIDKEAVMTEIEKIQNEFSNSPDRNGNFDELENQGANRALDILECFINTLEVKDVNLESSMVCKVDWYDGFLLDYTQEQQDELLAKIGADVGDKIRVMLIKE